MPTQDGYTYYKCSVCGREEYIHRDNKPARAKWKNHPYINMDDVQTDETVCDACEAKYRIARSNADAAHNAIVKPEKDDE